MAMYGVGLLPLITLVSHSNKVQKWYADDGNAVGKIDDEVETLKQLKSRRPFFGFHVTKCHLITKCEYIPIAIEKFNDLDAEVVAGHRVLGSVIGSSDFCEKFLHEKSKEHMGKLGKHAKISPQNVYKCLTTSVQRKLNFISGTTPKEVKAYWKTYLIHQVGINTPSILENTKPT